ATATAAGAAGTSRASGADARLLRRFHLSEVLREAGRHDLALVDPHLHADAAEGGARLVEAVVDVGAQGVQRHAAVGVALGARHLRAAEAAGHLDADALGAGTHRRGERALHRAAEGHTVLELLGH